MALVTGERVVIHLHTRRFVCRVRWCRRKVFTERLLALLAPYARRTTRQREQLVRDGLALGGDPGARHATAAGLPVSARTLLRLVRATPLPSPGPVRVLGVDDYAQRKGRRYETILVNLETHRVIDLLPDRSAETFAAWLRVHPEVRVIARDRGGAYADGARQGAPQALQVADRFHLRQNVTAALERFLTRKHAAIRQASPTPGTPLAASPVPPDPGEAAPLAPPLTRSEREKAARRERRQARYVEVLDLSAQGYSQRAVAQITGLSRETIQRFVSAEGFPERKERVRRPTSVTPFDAYLRARWAAGCRCATQLWRELRERGFTGRRGVVALYVQPWRTPGARCPARPPGGGRQTPPACAYTPRQTLWLLLRPPEDLTADDQAFLSRLYQACPHVALAQALAQEFAEVLRDHDVDGLYRWLHGVEASPIKELQGVARGMWLDRRAVEAAVSEPWSNGMTEGFVNKLKVRKRAMFGRAKFDLLRLRVVFAA